VDVRAKRAAQNENLFRRINERVEALSRGLESLTLVCECSDPACVEQIHGVPAAEYEAVRAHPNRFILTPGHESHEFEDVVDERLAYVIVSKRGDAAEVARNGDPRSE
jgi:hypothetical protein